MIIQILNEILKIRKFLEKNIFEIEKDLKYLLKKLY